jgi:hypothetical protein
MREKLFNEDGEFKFKGNEGGKSSTHTSIALFFSLFAFL